MLRRLAIVLIATLGAPPPLPSLHGFFSAVIRSLYDDLSWGRWVRGAAIAIWCFVNSHQKKFYTPCLGTCVCRIVALLANPITLAPI